LTRREKWRFGVTGSIILLTWLALVSGLATNGLFRPGALGQFPLILLALLGPIIIFSTILTRSKVARAVLDAIPLDWLIRIQVVRVLGGIFLVVYVGGLIPGVFALPAGIGDVATGVFALPVAYLVTRGSNWARSSAYAWNFFGMLDLVGAISLGFLSSPGPFQQLAFDLPNEIINQYPLVMIPVFAVPIMFILHILCLQKLTRDKAFASSASLKAS
jgi:hypothetical protein